MLERRLAFHYSFLFMFYQTPSAADQADAHKVVNSTQGNITPWKGCVTGLAHFSGKFWGHQKMKIHGLWTPGSITGLVTHGRGFNPD